MIIFLFGKKTNLYLMENKLEEKYKSLFLYENIWFEMFLFLFEMGVLGM
jgi:hypothetical protein